MTRGTALERALEAEARRWREAGLEREHLSGRLPGADFTSNDYLGLSEHAEVLDAAREAILAWGAGGRAARLLGGGCPAHAQAEQLAAEWLHAPRALLFPSGYQANLGAIGALAGPGDVLLSDSLNHASLIDAARLSRARVIVFRHGDVDEVRRLLHRHRDARRRLLVTESVFSMDGDLAPLGELAEACLAGKASMIVDEAHAIGLLGPEGAGGWAAVRDEDPSLDRAVAARVLTGGKALGVGGALLVGSAPVVEHIRQRARAFVFTTAPPPATAAALVQSMKVARRAEEPRARCLELGRRIAEALGRPAPRSAILPVVIGASERAMAAAAAIREQGLEVRAVRPPTVAPGTARLRIVTHSFNTDEEVARLIAAVQPHRPDEPMAPSSVRPRAATPLFVTGTDTGIGKTVVSALLLRAARRSGAASYHKPVQTGDDDDTAEVRRLAEWNDDAATRSPTLHFALPASPHEAAAAEGARIELDTLDRALDEECRRLAASSEDAGLVITELAGGLLVPLDDRRTQLDWLARRRAACVLVARSGLGTLNHSLLSLEALRARHLEPRALFLVGPPHESNRATLAARTELPVFELPVFPSLEPAALDEWLQRHDLDAVLQVPGARARS